MKNKDSILAKIWLKIVCILVAPAAVIHIAYQVWYFKNYMIKSGPEVKPQEKRPGLQNPTADKPPMRLDHFEEHIEIVITPFGEQLRLGARIDYYERKVLFGGQTVYSDTLDWQKSLTQHDPLSEFYNWLNNTGRYSRKVRTRRKEAYDRWQDLRRQMEELGEKRHDVATLAEQHHAAAPRP